MLTPRRTRLALVAALALFLSTFALAQRRDVYVESRNHPAIKYTSGDTTDDVAALNRKLQDGTVTLTFDPANGYLGSVLKALGVSDQSQALVFSQTSFQASLINMHNPRALFFNDTVAVGWVRGADVLEVAAQDPRQGVIFYGLEQKAGGTPRFARSEECLSCHLSWETLGVPGLLLQSMYPLPDDKNAYANGFTTVQGSPLEQRWGGWWVTGDAGGARHMGNVGVMPSDYKFPKLANPTRPLASVQGQFDLKGFPTPYSDVVAMLVFAHQTHMTNLLTRLGWEARVAAAAGSADAKTRVREAARDTVDYLLFADEAPLTGPVRGSSRFATEFPGRGRRDARGRSLRDLDLTRRLFKYPCSYMIDTPAFDALPAEAKEAVFARMWEILSGAAREPRYKYLTLADRQAIVEILRETKPGLPPYFARPVA